MIVLAIFYVSSEVFRMIVDSPYKRQLHEWQFVVDREWPIYVRPTLSTVAMCML